MTTLPSFLRAGEAKAARQDAIQLAASLWTQAADALKRDPHTANETLQAQAHRRSAKTC